VREISILSKKVALYLNWSEIEGNEARRNKLKFANDQRVAIMLFAIGLVRQINFPVLP
jgi:hypothetical protein